MKRRLAAITFFLVALSVYGQSRNIDSLDMAIDKAALQIQDDLDRGSRIIVYQFQSQSTGISDYVLKELFDKLVNTHKFTVLDRAAQEVIDAELYFQYTTSEGMISDESLASLTKRIGASAIVTGSLDDTGDEYRFRIRVIGTETTMAIVSYAGSVNKKDRKVAALTEIGRQKSIGEKIGTGALNIFLGLGSYLEGDIMGGLSITVGYAAAGGLFVIEAMLLDWDSPMVGVPATIGVTVAGITFVYGFVRPFIYNRSPHIAAVIDNIQPEIVLTSDEFTGKNSIGFQITYTLKF